MADRIETLEHERGLLAVHWSVVLAGSFVALGSWMFLMALGAAIGGQAHTPPNTWTAIYTLVAPIISLFFGGLVAARALGTRAGGALHGFVIWGFSMVIGAVLLALSGAIFFANRGGVAVPTGFSWWVCASILASLIACVLGCATVPSRRLAYYEHREPVRREVHT